MLLLENKIKSMDEWEVESRHKQFYKIDSEGKPSETKMFNLNKPIPKDYVEGWEGKYFNPIYDVTIGEWVESKPADEIRKHNLRLKEKNLKDVSMKEIVKGFDFTVRDEVYHVVYSQDIKNEIAEKQAFIRDGLLDSVNVRMYKDNIEELVNLSDSELKKLRVLAMHHEETIQQEFYNKPMKYLKSLSDKALEKADEDALTVWIKWNQHNEVLDYYYYSSIY